MNKAEAVNIHIHDSVHCRWDRRGTLRELNLSLVSPLEVCLSSELSSLPNPHMALGPKLPI